jgi:hypothetical protein
VILAPLLAIITATVVVLMINPSRKAARKPRIRAELNHLLQVATGHIRKELPMR